MLVGGVFCLDSKLPVEYVIIAVYAQDGLYEASADVGGVKYSAWFDDDQIILKPGSIIL